MNQTIIMATKKARCRKIQLANALRFHTQGWKIITSNGWFLIHSYMHDTYIHLISHNLGYLLISIYVTLKHSKQVKCICASATHKEEKKGSVIWKHEPIKRRECDNVGDNVGNDNGARSKRTASICGRKSRME